MIWLKTTEELLPTKAESGTFVKGACGTRPAPRALKGDLLRRGSNHKPTPPPGLLIGQSRRLKCAVAFLQSDLSYTSQLSTSHKKGKM